MYFPYFRGRQFELLALREMVEKRVMSSKIIPIVEPVKVSSTFLKTLEVYKRFNKSIAVIANPKVGSFNTEINEELNIKYKEKYLNVLANNSRIIFMNLLDKNSDPSEFIEKYSKNMGTICEDKDAIGVYEKFFLSEDTKFNLIPDESSYRRKIKTNKVLLADKFNKKPRNTDYADKIDEPFSDDHLYYLEDGYVGFADYSVIGKEYNETGFAPYAVAIHIVYFDEDKSLRIRHFVSDSNEDYRDTTKKFQEALSKLIEWNQEKKLSTIAINEFGELYRKESYPGLGTVKKLTIMHHLEMIGEYLDKG